MGTSTSTADGVAQLQDNIPNHGNPGVADYSVDEVIDLRHACGSLSAALEHMHEAGPGPYCQECGAKPAAIVEGSGDDAWGRFAHYDCLVCGSNFEAPEMDLIEDQYEDGQKRVHDGSDSDSWYIGRKLVTGISVAPDAEEVAPIQ